MPFGAADPKRRPYFFPARVFQEKSSKALIEASDDGDAGVAEDVCDLRFSQA